MVMTTVNPLKYYTQLTQSTDSSTLPTMYAQITWCQKPRAPERENGEKAPGK